MERSNTGIVIAILVAGGLIAGALIFTRAKPPEAPTPDPFQDMKAAVAAQMFDPGSATFQTLTEKIPGFVYCGEVNAKNRMGGYVGYKRFIAQKKHFSNEWIVTLDQRIVDALCK